jgi:hypothetical protein
MHIQTTNPVPHPSHQQHLQTWLDSRMWLEREDQEENRIWGTCSKRHSPVPRISHQTLNGLEAPSSNGDHTPPATTPSFHNSHGGHPAITTLSA